MTTVANLLTIMEANVAISERTHVLEDENARLREELRLTREYAERMNEQRAQAWAAYYAKDNTSDVASRLERLERLAGIRE